MTSWLDERGIEGPVRGMVEALVRVSAGRDEITLLKAADALERRIPTRRPASGSL